MGKKAHWANGPVVIMLIDALVYYVRHGRPESTPCIFAENLLIVAAIIVVLLCAGRYN